MKPTLPALRARGVRVPRAYPREYERTVTLADGRRAHLRPIVPADVDALRVAVAEADRDTLHNRFLGGRPPETDEEFDRLVTVDYARRFAVVALSDYRRGIGIARYEQVSDDAAEVAVAVDAGWRRVGLATALLRVLGEAASDHGITSFVADFLTDNVDIASILQDSRLPVSVTSRHGVTEATVAVGEAMVGVPGPPAVPQPRSGS